LEGKRESQNVTERVRECESEQEDERKTERHSPEKSVNECAYPTAFFLFHTPRPSPYPPLPPAYTYTPHIT